MPIQIVCPHCGAKGNAPDSIAGQQVRCSKCKNSFTAQSPPPQPAGNAFGFDESTAVAPEPLAAPELVEDDRPVRVTRSGGGGGGFVDFLMFRTFIGPMLVVIFFWIMFALTVLGGVLSFISPGGLWGIILGSLQLLIGPIILRFFCETIAVFFRMNERLAEIAELLKRERR